MQRTGSQGRTKRRLREAAVLAATLVFTGCCCDSCCRCCECSGTPASFRIPPDPVIFAKITAALATHEVIATNMCGVPAAGLAKMKLEKKTDWLTLPWGGRMHVSGEAIAKAGTKLAKPVACAGLVSWTIHSVTSGGKVTDWNLVTLELWEVETPGVTWSRPSTGGGGDWD